MNCFECFKSRTDSPDISKAQSAPLTSSTSPPSPGAKQTVIGVERSTGGGIAAPKRQAKFAYLEEVLKSKKGMEALRQYMTQTQQEHMLDFMEEVERYKSEADDAKRAKAAQAIFSTYLRVCADREISLDAPLRNTIVARLEQAPADLFNPAEQAVREEVRRDVFPRFLKTPLFERLAGLA